MIRANGLSFRHRGAGHDAVSGLDFSVRQGDLVCLAGENGSGKSTLLGLLAGVYTPDSGSLKISAPAERTARVGLVPQDPDIYILGSLVREDLFLALDPKNQAASERALNLARRFGLADLLDEAVHTLSYGQKKKLSLASALAAAPDLLLLDEPFAGLDYPSATAMREALAENKEFGLTQIICEHDLDLVADMADYFLLLNAGALAAAGNAAEVFPSMADNGVRPPCWWFSGASSPLWLKGSDS